MVKAKEGRITRPDLIALFEVLNMGMRAEKIVCPRSWFHREEGSLTSLGTAIQRYLRFISQLDFEPPFELEKRQFFNAACAFLGRAPLDTVGKSVWKATRTPGSDGSESTRTCRWISSTFGSDDSTTPMS